MGSNTNKIEPLVSIIIPVYNGSNYVEEAIDSALEQTYKNIEILVINDGSKDNTEEIVKKYGNKVRYIKKENGGVSTALNLGIEQMKGEYFSWLSHDDKYYPYKIENQINYLIKNDLLNTKTILYGNYSIMDEFGTINKNEYTFDHEELLQKPEYAVLRGAINGLTLLIPKKAFEECGNFRTDLRCIQDYELWYRMMSKYKFVHIDEVYAITRIHSKQVSSTSPKVLTEGNPMFIEFIDKINDKRKIELEGSIDNYYYENYKYFNITIYKEVADYCKTKFNKSTIDDNSFPLVTVVLETNNIKDANNNINLINEQTYKNIEIIIITNKKIKEQLNKKYSNKNIQYIVNINDIESRNKAIDLSKGKYILFINDDIIINIYGIEKIINKFKISYNTKFIATNIGIVDKKWNIKMEYPFEDFHYPLEIALLTNMKFNYDCVVYDAKMIKQNKIYFKNNKLDFIYNCLKYGNGIFHNESLFNVKVNNETNNAETLLKYINKFYNIKKDSLIYKYYNSEIDKKNNIYNKICNEFDNLFNNICIKKNYNNYTKSIVKERLNNFLKNDVILKTKINVLEVNNIDLAGQVFNGYNMIDELSNDEMFIKQAVMIKTSNNDNVISLEANENIISNYYKLMNYENDLSTIGVYSITTPALLNLKEYKDADIIHFHQFHNTRLSLYSLIQISREKKVILSLHDPYFLTGHCVHFFECDKWKTGCETCKFLDNYFPLKDDNSNELWKLKKYVFDNSNIDIVVYSKWMYDLVKQSPIFKNVKNIHCISFGFDVSKFDNINYTESRKKYNLNKDDIVLFTRAQAEFKGTEYIYEALKSLKIKKNIVILTCDQIDQFKGLEDRYKIIDLGNITSDEMCYAMNACDIFLMPSKGESFGMMAAEAMACSKPVIVFDNTALPITTFAPECGYLVKNKDSKDLAKAIEYLINNPKEREERGKLGRKLCLENYNLENYNNNLKELYKTVFNYKLDYNNKTIEPEENNDIRKIYQCIKLNKKIKNVPKIEYSNPAIEEYIQKCNNELYLKSFSKKSKKIYKVKAIIRKHPRVYKLLRKLLRRA